MKEAKPREPGKERERETHTHTHQGFIPGSLKKVTVSLETGQKRNEFCRSPGDGNAYFEGEVLNSHSADNVT